MSFRIPLLLAWLLTAVAAPAAEPCQTLVCQAKLRAYDWNVSETARALDMPRSNLYKKIERYALSREGGGVPAPVSGSDEDDDA